MTWRDKFKQRALYKGLCSVCGRRKLAAHSKRRCHVCLNRDAERKWMSRQPSEEVESATYQD